MALTGREANVAFAKFATNSWGVAASVTKGVHLESDAGLTPQPQYVESETFNQGFLSRAEVGDFTAPDLTLTQQGRYEDHAYILEALLMGSPAAPTVVSSTGGNAYRHIIDLSPKVDGLGITLAFRRGELYTEELTSAKVYGLSETFGTGGVVQQSFRVLGSKPTNQSSINTNSTVGGANYPGFGSRIFRKHGVFRMNLQTAASLVAADEIKIESFNLELTRPQDAPFVTGQDFIHEPGDNGFPELVARVQFPRMTTVTANSMYRLLTAGTALKADMTYTGALINSTTSASKLYQMPYVELQEWAAPLTGANQVKPTATLRLKEVTAAPSGMTRVTRPLRITRVMANSAVAF
jgi:hypothetical protein